MNTNEEERYDFLQFLALKIRSFYFLCFIFFINSFDLSNNSKIIVFQNSKTAILVTARQLEPLFFGFLVRVWIQEPGPRSDPSAPKVWVPDPDLDLSDPNFLGPKGPKNLKGPKGPVVPQPAVEVLRAGVGFFLSLAL